MEKERREVASLTKIMTIYTVFALASKLKVDLSERITIHASCESVIGTSADLAAGDTLTIHELLHGLMLPSGNDAAHMLALHFGTLLMQQPEDADVPSFSSQVNSIQQIRSQTNPFLAQGSQYSGFPEIAAFISEMNKNCVRLGLRSSFFDSPHGLMNQLSRSTAFDIAKLSATCLKDKRFVKIVTTKTYSVEKSGPDWQNRRSYRWENTHKMNGQSGVISVKTGITQAAGPCLATAVEFEAGIKLVIVLLSAKDMDCRWLETHKLGKWATKRLSQIKTFGKGGA